MRLIFLGSGAFAQPTLRWLAQSEHQIVSVMTQPPRPSGRGRRMARTPVGVVAEELGLPLQSVENVNDPAVVAEVSRLGAEVAIVIAFGQFLRSDLLATITGGFINLHASLLPKYRGAAPINWALVRGERRTGCTVFRIDERMDAGPILASRAMDIEPGENAGELHDRLADLGEVVVQEALALYESDTNPVGLQQDETQATLAPKLKKSDGLIDFGTSASALAHHIAGMTPWPGAAAHFEAAGGRWERIAILRARSVDEKQTDFTRSLAPGTLDDRLHVATGDGFLEILDVKPTSGRVMTWRDYVNGRGVVAGDRFALGE